MKFAIERATARDAEEIGHLFDLYRRFYGQPAERAAAIAFLRDRLERDESVVFVARNDARGTIGFAQLYPLFCSVALKRQWLLYDPVHASRECVAPALRAGCWSAAANSESRPVRAHCSSRLPIPTRLRSSSTKARAGSVKRCS